MFKKTITATLSLMILISSIGVSSFANEYEPKQLKTEDQILEEFKDKDVVLINSTDEYFSYVADALKKGESFYLPEFTASERYYGWQDDFRNLQYYFKNTEQGRCISNIFNPKVVVFQAIKSLSKSGIKKLGIKGIAKKLTGLGVPASIAWSAAECIYMHPFS